MVKLPDKYDLINKKFGKLTPIKYLGVIDVGSDRRAAYLCSCECGNKKEVTAKNLKLGKVQSCGCIRAAKPENRKKTKQAKKEDAKRRREQRDRILRGLGYDSTTPYKDLFEDLEKISSSEFSLMIFRYAIDPVVSDNGLENNELFDS
jgi:hypothetical protein